MDIATTTPQTTDIVAQALVTTVAEAAVYAKAAKKNAADLFTKAETDAIAVLLNAGIESVTLADGTKVTLKGGLAGEETRTVSATDLADLVPATVLDKVTKRTVDLTAFDAAVTAGLIAPEVVAKVTTTADKKRSLVITVPTTARK